MLIMQKILIVITLLLFNFHEVIPLQSQSFSSIVIMANYTAYQFAININVEYVFLYPINNVSINIFIQIIFCI